MSKETKIPVSEMIDKLVPKDVEEFYQNALTKCKKENNDIPFAAFFPFIEQARGTTVKRLFSSSHQWTKAIAVSPNDFKTEIFWCQNCDLKASVFENINCLSLIKKVSDRQPVYTVHSEYIHKTCEEIKELRYGATKSCEDCGVPEELETSDCKMLMIE